jgi:hypothetical protein
MGHSKDDLRPDMQPMVEITIQEKTDPLADQIIGVKDDERIIFLSPQRVFIKKGAMSSGKASVTIYAKTAQGEHVFFETSGKILKMIAELVIGIDGWQL